jgi:hypothetical protein
VPPASGYVRAVSQTSGYIAKAIRLDDGSIGTRLTYVVQMDPAGWIPSYIANAVALAQPMCVAAIRKLVESGRAHFQINPAAPRPVLAAPAHLAFLTPDELAAAASAAPADTLPPPPAPTAAAAAAAVPAAATALPPPVAVTAASAPPARVDYAAPGAMVAQPAGPGDVGALARTLHALTTASAAAAAQMQGVGLALDRLLQHHTAQQAHLGRIAAQLGSVAETERRLREAEGVWDARLQQLEGPLLDAEWLSAFRHLEWRAVAAIGAVLVLWPVLANLLWSVLRQRLRRQ